MPSPSFQQRRTMDPSRVKGSRRMVPGITRHFLCAVGITLAVTVNAVILAAPVEQKSWILSLENNATEATQLQRIKSMYGSAGLASAQSDEGTGGLELLTIGNFRAVIAPMGDAALRQQLQGDDGVASVEAQQEWSIDAPIPEPVPTPRPWPFPLPRPQDAEKKKGPPPANDTTGGINPARGLNQIAPRKASAGGRSVKVFVIDTGADVTHPAFAGEDGRPRVEMVDFTGEGNSDAKGHGTHVCGTITGNEFGIARSASVYALKVFSESGKGTNANVLRALEEVSKQTDGNVPCVVNMSLGGPKSDSESITATQRAIQELSKRNCAVVVAAGNAGKDACETSPAFVPEAITVAAADLEGKLAKFSNYGKCVDVIAPGVKVISAAVGGGERLSSGTSMASPVIAGTMAVLMSEGLNAKQAEQRLMQIAAAKVEDSKGSPNRVITPPEIAATLTGEFGRLGLDNANPASAATRLAPNYRTIGSLLFYSLLASLLLTSM